MDQQNGGGTSTSRATAPTDEAAAAPSSLPDDVLTVEIFLLLPAKSVLRFRAVCKPWCRLLSDPVFIRDHHRRAPLTLLLNDTRVDNGDAIFALPPSYIDQSKAAPLYCGITSENTVLEGCCDGLLLLSCKSMLTGYKYRYFVCNPVTREFARLPADLEQVELVGFYRHTPTDEYRVLCHYYRSSILERYEIDEYLVAVPGQRKARPIGPSNLSKGIDWRLIGAPVTHCGCLHWKLRRPSLGVVVFDTISEKFRRMRGPVDGDTSMDQGFAGQLVGVDETLGMSLFPGSGGEIMVWVLVNYEEEVWDFRYHIDVSFLNRGDVGFWSISLVHVSDEDDALFVTKVRKLVGVYNIRRGEVVSASQELFRGRLLGTDHVYKESLVSLAPKCVGDPTPPS